jgi:hypothetical protein
LPALENEKPLINGAPASIRVRWELATRDCGRFGNRVGIKVIAWPIQ